MGIVGSAHTWQPFVEPEIPQGIQELSYMLVRAIGFLAEFIICMNFIFENLSYTNLIPVKF